MKVAFTALLAGCALLGIARAREPHRLPENYRDWLAWTPPVDRRPFLVRFFSRPSLWAEVGAKKAKIKADSAGVNLSGSFRDSEPITARDLFPTGLGVGVRFGTDL